MSRKNVISYDPQCDVLYIAVKRGKEEEFVEVAPGVNVELDEKGAVVGIEILDAAKFFKPIAKPLYEHMQMNKF